MINEILTAVGKKMEEPLKSSLFKLSDENRLDLYKFIFRRKSRRITGQADLDWEIRQEALDNLEKSFKTKNN